MATIFNQTLTLQSNHLATEQSLHVEVSKPVKREQVKKPSKAPVKTVKPSKPPVQHSDSLQQWLYKLRMCESTNNYKANTGNGYFGAYQFLDSTWDYWKTGYARADLAPPSVQDATIIKNTNATEGLSTQNPGCYVKMGLSNYPPK